LPGSCRPPRWKKFSAAGGNFVGGFVTSSAYVSRIVIPEEGRMRSKDADFGAIPI
jgi:hypothetical protein